MKKFFGSEWGGFIMFLLCGFLSGAFFLGGCTVCGWIDWKDHEVYPLTAQIVELDRNADVVVCIDGTGNSWAFYGVEDWQVGDFASLLMDNNGTTETIYDDVIIMAHYAGTFKG